MAQDPKIEHQEQTPTRYRHAGDGDDTYLECGGSPNIHLHVRWGLAVDEAGREKYPPQTIFLDGAFTGPPFLDNSGRHYSLDHHAGGTPRGFMLATCEQAVVMVLDGLPLEEGEWQLYINDPDLDAVLAAWADASIAIKTAAVADFRPAQASAQKIRKEDLGPEMGLTLELVRNPDMRLEFFNPVVFDNCLGIAHDLEDHDVSPMRQDEGLLVAQRGIVFLVQLETVLIDEFIFRVTTIQIRKIIRLDEGVHARAIDRDHPAGYRSA